MEENDGEGGDHATNMQVSAHLKPYIKNERSNVNTQKQLA